MEEFKNMEGEKNMMEKIYFHSSSQEKHAQS